MKSASSGRSHSFPPFERPRVWKCCDLTLSTQTVFDSGWYCARIWFLWVCVRCHDSTPCMACREASRVSSCRLVECDSKSFSPRFGRVRCPTSWLPLHDMSALESVRNGRHGRTLACRGSGNPAFLLWDRSLLHLASPNARHLRPRRPWRL